MIYTTILCLGDSLTAGARAEHDGHAGLGYPEWLVPVLDRLCAENAQAEPAECAVLNRGISGQTTRQIADRAPAAVRELAGYAGNRWAVILAGTNDSKADGCDLGEWELLYRQVVHWARRAGVAVALCTFPPVDPAAMSAFTPASSEWLARASERVRAMATEFDGRPVPVQLVDLSTLPASMLVDGVHLTTEGNREVACRVVAAMTHSDLARVRSLAPPVGASRYAARFAGEEVPPPKVPRKRQRKVPGTSGSVE